MKPMLEKHNVTGSVIFPLLFPSSAVSYESAASYANSILNNQQVLKVEIECHTADGKIHLIICDTFDFKWDTH
jgi:hypothetical protein